MKNKTDFTIDDSRMTQGVAIVCMIMGHLYWYKGTNVPGTPLIWITRDRSLVFYLAFLCDITVPLYCFVSGYGLYYRFTRCKMQVGLYYRKSLRKILNLLVRFQVVCILYFLLGMLFDPSLSPSWYAARFPGSCLLLENYANGAWWYVATYISFILISPLFLLLLKKDSGLETLRTGILWFALYLYVCHFRFDVRHLTSRPAPWESGYWKALLLRRSTDLWFVGSCILIGMGLAKLRLVERLRKRWYAWNIRPVRNSILIVLLLLLSIFLCVKEDAILVYFSAPLFFILLNLMEKNKILSRILLFLGKHSINIWLFHMAFYLHVFEGLVYKAEYPVLVLLFMFALSIGTSYLINWLMRPVYRILTKIMLP